MSEELYIAGSCNIGTREIMRRRIVALSGLLFAVITAINRPDNATIRRRMISRVPILQLPAMYKSTDIRTP